MAANGNDAEVHAADALDLTGEAVHALAVDEDEGVRACRPRSEAVCAEKVVAPITLVRRGVAEVLFAETRFSSSIALVAPLLSISSRVMTVTGRALSPSTRLMLSP